MTILRSPEPSKQARCPKCANTQGIIDGGPSARGVRTYDIYSDTFGTLSCPHCGTRERWIEFHKPPTAK